MCARPENTCDLHKIHDVARLTARCVLFASIFHYTPLFETIRTIRYLLFGFPDTHREVKRQYNIQASTSNVIR